MDLLKMDPMARKMEEHQKAFLSALTNGDANLNDRMGDFASSSGEDEPSDAEDLDDNEAADEKGEFDSEYNSDSDSVGSLNEFICNDDHIDYEDDYDPDRDHLNWGSDHDKNLKQLEGLP